MNWTVVEEGKWRGQHEGCVFHVGRYYMLSQDKPYYLTGLSTDWHCFESVWCSSLEEAKELALSYVIEKELDRGCD